MISDIKRIYKVTSTPDIIINNFAVSIMIFINRKSFIPEDINYTANIYILTIWFLYILNQKQNMTALWEHFECLWFVITGIQTDKGLLYMELFGSLVIHHLPSTFPPFQSPDRPSFTHLSEFPSYHLALKPACFTSSLPNSLVSLFVVDSCSWLTACCLDFYYASVPVTTVAGGNQGCFEASS